MKMSAKKNFERIRFNFSNLGRVINGSHDDKKMSLFPLLRQISQILVEAYSSV